MSTALEDTLANLCRRQQDVIDRLQENNKSLLNVVAMAVALLEGGLEPYEGYVKTMLIQTKQKAEVKVHDSHN